MASWQARWTVAGRITGVLRPKLHLAELSTSRAGPPTSDRKRSH